MYAYRVSYTLGLFVYVYIAMLMLLSFQLIASRYAFEKIIQRFRLRICESDWFPCFKVDER